MEVDAAVLGDAAVGDGGRGVVAVGDLEVLEEKGGRKVGLAGGLPVQPREVDVLGGVAG